MLSLVIRTPKKAWKNMAAKEMENNGNDGNGNAGDVMLVILMAEW